MDHSASFSPLISASLSVMAGLATYRLMGHPKLHENFIRCGLSGRDLHRIGRPTVPEAMGVICGLSFLIVAFIFIPFAFIPWKQGVIITNDSFPFDSLSSYLSALLSLTCMLFLGFTDDVLELQWRFKLLLPMIASIPLLLVYYVTCNVTTMVIPRPFNFWLPPTVDLGVLYYVYMGSLAVFCTNSINILAGVNGVETGQALIIALSIAVNDILYLVPFGVRILDRKSISKAASELHRFSLCMIIPFIAVTWALYMRNRYPAQVFVGDTFCYFSGMIFAVVGILGRYSKTLLLFFVPQIFNFLYSVPQLFRMVPCPRHRMPAYDPDEDLLYPSYTTIARDRSIFWLRFELGVFFLRLFHTLGLVHLATRDTMLVGPASIRSRSDSPARPKKIGSRWHEQYSHVNNLTLLNLVLIKFGPMREADLTRRILLIQIIFGMFLAFGVRYGLVQYAFPQ